MMYGAQAKHFLAQEAPTPSTRADSGSSDGGKSVDNEDVEYFKQKMHAQFRKTTMCKFHILGMCNRGDACAYAHEASELRVRPDLSRTKLCEEYASTGRCSRGPNCSFAHSSDELRTTYPFHKTKQCRFFPSGKCERGARCRFAHDQSELVPVVEKGNGTQDQVGEQNMQRKNPMPKKQGNQPKQPQVVPALKREAKRDDSEVAYIDLSQMSTSLVSPPGLETGFPTAYPAPIQTWASQWSTLPVPDNKTSFEPEDFSLFRAQFADGDNSEGQSHVMRNLHSLLVDLMSQDTALGA